MRNFMMGFLLGGLLTYCYLNNDNLRGAANDWWSWASSPPAHADKHAQR